MVRKVLINCDDLGMHSCINEGIVEILRQGYVTSASLLPTGTAFSDACRRLKRADIRTVGVHLALSAEYSQNPLRPIARPEQVASLCQMDGAFFADVKIQSPAYDLAEVEFELQNQIEAVYRSGFDVSHLDGHMFFYHPEEGGEAILEIVRRLASRYRLPFRLPSHLGGNRRVQMLWDGADEMETRFECYLAMLNENQEEYELIIHPARHLEQLQRFTRVGIRRIADFEFFTSPLFFECVRQQKIEIISWKNVKERMFCNEWHPAI